MSAPILWVLLPGLAGAALLLVRNRHPWPGVISGGLSAALALAAVFLQPGEAFGIGPLQMTIGTTLTVFGRRFVFLAGDSGLLALIYGVAALWFFGGLALRAPGRFYPLGLMMTALLVAALAVEPFLYAALLVEMAVLVSIPLLAEPDRRPGFGLLRYLIFQSLGMPFVLLAGWMLGSVEVIPERELLFRQASVLLGLGFSFWLAVFPFYTWVPLLVEESRPYLAGFAVSMLTTVLLFMMADFINGFTWLRGNAGMYQVLQIAGAVMVVVAGVSAAFSRKLQRLFGHVLIAENGFALLAMSLRSQAGMEIFATGLLPRLMTLALFALGMGILTNRNVRLDLPDLQGLARRFPVSAGVLVLAVFSFGGLPLLGSFPVRQGLYELLAGQNVNLVFAVLASTAGFLLAGFRMLAAFIVGGSGGEAEAEGDLERLMLLAGTLCLVLIGLLPGPMLRGLLQVLLAFPNLR